MTICPYIPASTMTFILVLQTFILVLQTFIMELPSSSYKPRCKTHSSWYFWAVILQFTAWSTAGKVAPGEFHWASLCAKMAASEA